MFGAGINTANVLNVLLSTSELKSADKRAEIARVAASANTTRVSRRPGGEWVPCSSLHQASHLRCYDFTV
jgi:hypothetical protein